MPWGKVSGQNQFTLVDPGRTPTGVLELFLMGGLSPWETLYVAPEFGKPGPGFRCCTERHSPRTPEPQPSRPPLPGGEWLRARTLGLLMWAVRWGVTLAGRADGERRAGHS